MNRKTINLSTEEENEFINCFMRTDSKHDYKQIAISYIERFVGNKMSASLYTRLFVMITYYTRFRLNTILIKDEAYMLFSINDYFRLIKVENICPADIKTFSKRYDNIVEKNGYQIIYSVGIDWNIYGKKYSYIKFIICKDDIVFAMNKYQYNKPLDLTIEHTLHNFIINEEHDYKNYEFEMPGLIKKEIEEVLNSIFIINELKAGDK